MVKVQYYYLILNVSYIVKVKWIEKILMELNFIGA
jgi:hypothetical protein